jgi:hypothetical protein
MPLLGACSTHTWGAYLSHHASNLIFAVKRWIFYKPTYERMELVDREDLDSDPGAPDLSIFCGSAANEGMC